ncbi:MAG TPA: glycosyltransferase family 4 protein [Planctomycetota bacterium]|nr:glycosyltransferase family 4 protein [Planctomycetota bacterium]
MLETAPHPASRPRVVVVANARIPGERAQSIQTVRTAAAFARRGCEVDLVHPKRNIRRTIAGADGDPLAFYGVTDPVHLHALPVVDWIERAPRRLQYVPARIEEWTFARAAARWIRGAGGALVHCREIEVGARLAAARDARYLFEAHSIPGSRLRRAWLSRAVAGALAVVAISRGLADDLAAACGIPRERVAVVPDAFEAREYAAPLDRAEARRRLGIPQDAQVVVYAGHLFPWKGSDVLVRASAQAPTITVRLVGGLPEDVERTRRLAKERGASGCEVVGHRPPSEIPIHLAAADVVAVPNSGREPISARHTSPLKLFEAMAAGRAIVASDLPSLREVVEHDRTAWLVPPDDPDALAAGLRRLVADPERCERLGAAAREKAGAFTYDARAARLLELAGIPASAGCGSRS